MPCSVNPGSNPLATWTGPSSSVTLHQTCYRCALSGASTSQTIQFVLRQALVLRTTEPISTLTGGAGPALNKPPARQGMFGGLGEPSEPPISDSAGSTLTPLVDAIGEAAAPPLADVSVAAGDKVGLTDAPTQAEPDTAEAAPVAQLVARAVEQNSNRDEQVRQVVNCYPLPLLTASIPDNSKRLPCDNLRLHMDML